MDNIGLKLMASVVCATFFCFMTFKTVGAIQQGGYRNRNFLKWICRGDNMFFNRLFVLSICLLLSSTLTSLCFSFLGVTWALSISAVPFLFFLAVFVFVDFRYALKVPAKATGRFYRLFAVYWLLTMSATWGVIELLCYVSFLINSPLYSLIAFAPFSLVPMGLPFLLCLANFVTRIFEEARNRKYVERAREKLNARDDLIRIGVVGSFGKTSVKRILTAILSEKYNVLATPASYNTPIGIAKTVFSKRFPRAQILIAEMGARKTGDIGELCRLVRPDYGVFTGVCEQHISSFKNLENVFAEKSEIIRSGAKVVCAASLKERVNAAFGEREKVIFASQSRLKDITLSATETIFSLRIQDEWIEIKTKLLGVAAMENIMLAATLATELGLTAQEIARGVAKIQAIPHRLQLIEANGVYILDDGYNANPRGAVEALAALSRFAGRKCVVTPGIVECGVLEEKINAKLGERIAEERLDLVILVGDTLIGAVKKGYIQAGGDETVLKVVRSLDEAKTLLGQWTRPEDAVLFLNDLPDVY